MTVVRKIEPDKDQYIATVTVADLRSRIQEHSRESQMLMSGVMKSITVANAAYILAALVASPVSPLLWLPFWITTFFIIILSFTAQVTSTLLAAYDADWRETTIVFTQTIWEFLMMSALTPRNATVPMLSAWYLAAALHAAGGALALRNLWSKFGTIKYSPALEELVGWYRRGLGENIPRAAVLAGISISVWIVALYVLPRFPGLEMWQGIFPLLQLVGLFSVMRTMERDRAMILSFIRNCPDE
jgi:hypothetical protein